MSYDRALTVFSPDGHLFQVEYAMEVVKKGTAAVGICGQDCVVIGAEKKTIETLQDDRTIKKIFKLDEHIYATFAGLAADARILMNKAQVECQSYRLNVEDPITVELVARFIAQTQQKYTQKGGARPFGIATLLAGLDKKRIPSLYLTEPSGIHSAWKANAIGRSSNVILEFLEKHYSPSLSEKEAIMLAGKALLEVVQSGAKNIDICLVTAQGMRYLELAELEDLIQTIEREKAEAEAEAKRKAALLPSASSSMDIGGA